MQELVKARTKRDFYLRTANFPHRLICLHFHRRPMILLRIRQFDKPFA